MKICIVSEFFNPIYGGQYSAVKGLVDICKFKKIEHIVIHKNSKICDDKTGIEKLISKYDDNPTPSHPTNIWRKLPAVTRINIKKVNNDK